MRNRKYVVYVQTCNCRMQTHQQSNNRVTFHLFGINVYTISHGVKNNIQRNLVQTWNNFSKQIIIHVLKNNAQSQTHGNSRVILIFFCLPAFPKIIYTCFVAIWCGEVILLLPIVIATETTHLVRVRAGGTKSTRLRDE